MSTIQRTSDKGPLRRRVAGALLLGAILALFPTLSRPSDRAPKPPISVRVVCVIDGDTTEICCIGWKRESIRYIGIDTPETSHPTKGVERYAREAGDAEGSRPVWHLDCKHTNPDMAAGNPYGDGEG